MTRPFRVLRQIVAPNGRHRPHPVAALLDETSLLAADAVAANESAPCPTCARTTFHALNRDGSRTCWTCRTATPGES
ncbi:hypothetical protein ACFYRN_45305 [Streptomyces sp. NPDC005227]|uniref:hypothetical protein n=1 Tax=Streptomyces sp. NPDC005227 TaxID=3364707 RepID=UPI003676859D